ncbi:MAG: permease prefix domain 1-containing protein [Oscillospiraceae bacterium]|nr:permease prefix domain 1-containing protein [Oscillospiraceae bacterium]
MKDEIRKHVNKLFEDAPKTKRAYDLKEELISNLNEKYNDLVASGKTEKESYDNVIAGIGDVSELVSNLETSNPMNELEQNKWRKKTALIVSISIGLYILAIISCIVISVTFESVGVSGNDLMDAIPAIAFLVIAAIPTCIIVYHFMSKPKYIKVDNTLVEEFKEWKSVKEKNVSTRKAISSVLWSIIVLVYLVISFVFNAWAYSWIIFIIGAVLRNIITLLIKLKEGV